MQMHRQRDVAVEIDLSRVISFVRSRNKRCLTHAKRPMMLSMLSTDTMYKKHLLEVSANKMEDIKATELKALVTAPRSVHVALKFLQGSSSVVTSVLKKMGSFNSMMCIRCLV